MPRCSWTFPIRQSNCLFSYTLNYLFVCYRHGSWTSKSSIPGENPREDGKSQETTRSQCDWAEEGCPESAGPRLPHLQGIYYLFPNTINPFFKPFHIILNLGANARSENLQAAFRKQTSKERFTGRAEGRRLLAGSICFFLYYTTNIIINNNNV